MKIVFFGTPNYVIPVVDNLYRVFKSKTEDSPIVAVVTQEPKPAGRKKILHYSPIDTWAHKKSIPIYFNPKGLITDNIEADLGVLASYGVIISNEVINHFPHGILNIHPSLLPKYRGSSPVQAALMSGDVLTGATIMKLDEKLDHGPIVAQFNEDITDDDTTETLRNRLFDTASEVLSGLIPAYVQGKIKIKTQDHEMASFTKQIKKEDAFIEPQVLAAVMKGNKFDRNWDINFIKDFTTHYSPLTVHQFIRAMQPWPLSWTYVKLSAESKAQSPKRLLLHKSHIENGKLVLDEVQMEGKGVVTWKQFKEGYPQINFS